MRSVQGRCFKCKSFDGLEAHSSSTHEHPNTVKTARKRVPVHIVVSCRNGLNEKLSLKAKVKVSLNYLLILNDNNNIIVIKYSVDITVLHRSYRDSKSDCWIQSPEC